MVDNKNNWKLVARGNPARSIYEPGGTYSIEAEDRKHAAVLAARAFGKDIGYFVIGPNGKRYKLELVEQ